MPPLTRRKPPPRRPRKHRARSPRPASGTPRTPAQRVLQATALAAMTCTSGPPCTPGKTARSISLAHSGAHSTSPPRGPRSVLCVVVVTKSRVAARATGEGRSPRGRRCAPCRPSAARRRRRRPPGTAEIDHRAGTRWRRPRSASASRSRRVGAKLVVVDALRLLPHAVRDDAVELPGDVERMAVRQVAAVRERHPRSVSPGFRQAT